MGVRVRWIFRYVLGKNGSPGIRNTFLLRR
jgi:hypothetical protein